MFKKKSQSTLEYAVLISIAVAAGICMLVYVQRGIQGHLRGSATKLTPEIETVHPADKFKLRPQATLESKGQGVIKEEDGDFGINKVLGNDFAYSRGATVSFSVTDSIIEESATTQGKSIKTNNETQKTTVRQEYVLPLSQEPRRW